jgi:hypothetical protein
MRMIYAAAALLASAAFTALPAKADSVVLGFNIVNGQQVAQSWNTDNVSVLQLTSQVPNGNQVKNIPCIICANNQPQQPAGFGYNQFGNNGDGHPTVAFFSTAIVPPGPGSGLALDQIGTGYNVGAGSAFLAALGGLTTFTVGIDINDNSNAQTLESFWFLNLTTHTVLAAFSPGPGGTLVPDINNGTGFPDYTITGFDLNRGDIHVGDQIIFFARMTDANDGPDSFFVNPNVAAVPGPIVGAGPVGLAAAGLFGLNFWRRRRNGGALPT